MNACNGSGERDWSVFLPYIAPYVKGAPDVLMGHMARLAAIEFARDTGVITRDIIIDTQAGVSDYPLQADDDYTITGIKGVCVSGRPIKVVRDTACGVDRWRGYRFVAPRDLYIYPAPMEDAQGCVVATVTLIPGQDSCYVDPILYHEFAELIGDGAVSRLLMTRSASWYDPQTSQLFLAKFLAAIRKAKLSQIKQRSAEPQYMKGVRFV